MSLGLIQWSKQLGPEADVGFGLCSKLVLFGCRSAKLPESVKVHWLKNTSILPILRFYIFLMFTCLLHPVVNLVSRIIWPAAQHLQLGAALECIKQAGLKPILAVALSILYQWYLAVTRDSHSNDTPLTATLCTAAEEREINVAPL